MDGAFPTGCTDTDCGSKVKVEKGRICSAYFTDLYNVRRNECVELGHMKEGGIL